MLAKFARRIRRRSLRPDLEITQDTRGIQIVDELVLHPQREVVDTAPDLLHSCSLETPFPTVSFGGYMKYYRDRTEMTEFADPYPLFGLSATPSPLSRNDISPPTKISSLTPSSPESPTIDIRAQETESLKTRRKAARHSFSGPFSISEKNPKLFRSRWKRATCIISSSIAEHELSPLFSRSSNSDTDLRRPSFELAQSLSSKGSGESDSSDSPDSVTLQFRHTSPDSEFTLPPDTPTSNCSNVDQDTVVVVEPHDTTTSHSSNLGTRTWLQPRCRPVSTSSYATALSVFG